MSKAVLGIDVGKLELSVAILIDHKFITAKVKNNVNGYTEIINLMKKNKINKITACLEATGSYGDHVADFLYANNYEVAVVNPFCIKAFANSKLTIHKTDTVDAKIIAEYASKNKLTLYKPRSPEIKKLRELCTALENYKIQQTQIKCYIEHSTSSNISKSWNRLLKYIDKEMLLLQQEIEKILESIPELKQDCDNLQTIPGIGKTTAIALLSYIPDLSNFKNARQLAAYSGLVPRHKISGISVKGKSKLSKMGSNRLRKALFFPAIVGSKYNSILVNFCNKLKGKGKAKISVIGAAMRKLLHIIFAVLKNKTTFNAEHNI